MNRSWLLFPEQLSMGEPSLSGSGEDPNCGETQILSEGLFCSLNIMFTLGPFWPFEVRSIFKNSQCTMYILGSMFSLQPNKLRHILKVASWWFIQHIFVSTCSVGRKKYGPVSTPSSLNMPLYPPLLLIVSDTGPSYYPKCTFCHGYISSLSSQFLA